tara:strand:+ start:816 stop:1046 length:231 start_codon:yes stop_codon:yes gene_type:complete
MGRIKTTLVKRTGRQLNSKTPESFGKEFEGNKKALGHTLPSKRMRNMVAGFITRFNRNKKSIIDDVNNKDDNRTEN